MSWDAGCHSNYPGKATAPQIQSPCPSTAWADAPGLVTSLLYADSLLPQQPLPSTSWFLPSVTLFLVASAYLSPLCAPLSFYTSPESGIQTVALRYRVLIGFVNYCTGQNFLIRQKSHCSLSLPALESSSIL
jgi:hypothetical protein